MPARLPPHKTAEEDPGAQRRLAMCRLLVGATPGLDVSALELERDGPSYTVDTLRALHETNPDVEITFITGADVARTLSGWSEPLELLRLADLAVATRADSGAREVRAALDPLLRDFRARFTGAALARRPGGPVRFLSMPALDLSSSLVRDRIHRGEAVGELVGPAVAGYIAARDLYNAPAAAPARPEASMRSEAPLRSEGPALPEASKP